MKIAKLQGTLVALAAAALFTGCAQKAGSGSGDTCGGDRGAAMDSKNGCPAHGNACKSQCDSCKADAGKAAGAPSDKSGDNCGGKDGCGAP